MEPVSPIPKRDPLKAERSHEQSPSNRILPITTFLVAGIGTAGTLIFLTRQDRYGEPGFMSLVGGVVCLPYAAFVITAYFSRRNTRASGWTLGGLILAVGFGLGAHFSLLHSQPDALDLLAIFMVAVLQAGGLCLVLVFGILPALFGLKENRRE